MDILQHQLVMPVNSTRRVFKMTGSASPGALRLVDARRVPSVSLLPQRLKMRMPQVPMAGASQ